VRCGGGVGGGGGVVSGGGRAGRGFLDEPRIPRLGPQRVPASSKEEAGTLLFFCGCARCCGGIYALGDFLREL